MSLRLLLVPLCFSLAGGFAAVSLVRGNLQSRRVYHGALKAATTESEDEAFTLYGLLGVPSNATAGDIKIAYRQAVRSVHPDVSDLSEGDDERFRILTEAYKTLSDPELRQAYDSKIRADKVAAFAASVAGLGFEIVKDVGIPVATAAVTNVAVPFLWRTAKQSAAAATAAAGKAQKAMDEGAPLGEIATNAFAAAGEAAKRASIAQDLSECRKKNARVALLLEELRLNVTEVTTMLRRLDSEVAEKERARTGRYVTLKAEEREYERLQKLKDVACEEAAKMEEASNTAFKEENDSEKKQKAAVHRVADAEKELELAARALELAQQRLRESKREVSSSRDDMNKAERQLVDFRDRAERAQRYSAISQERLNDSISRLRAREESRDKVRKELRRLDIERANLVEKTTALRPKLQKMQERMAVMEKRAEELRQEEAALRTEERDEKKKRS